MPPKRRGIIPALFILRALRFPNYRLWFAGQSVSLIGTWMQIVAQQWVVYEITGSKFMLGAIAFAGSLPTFFLMLPAGLLADRLPKRTILLYTQTISMLLAFVLAILLATGKLQVWHVFVLATLLGIVNSADAPARQAFTVEIIDDRRDLLNAIALNSSMFNLARVIGPAVAGLVLATLGAAWCFGVNGASFIAVIAGLVAIRVQTAAVKPVSGAVQQVREGVHFARHHPVILPLILLTTISGLFAMTFGTLMPAFAVEVLHRGEEALGLLNAAVGVGALLGSVFVAATARAVNRRGPLILGCLLFPAALAAFAFSTSYAVSLLLLTVVGFGVVVQNTSINSLIQMQVSDEMRGRVLSIYLLAFFGASPIGSLQLGIVAQATGPAIGMAISASLALILTAGVFLASPGLRRI
jgi:MFS family permease